MQKGQIFILKLSDLFFTLDYRVDYRRMLAFQNELFRQYVMIIWVFISHRVQRRIILGVNLHYTYTWESFCIHWSALLVLWRRSLWWNQGWSHVPRCYLECPDCNLYIKFFRNFLVIDIWCELELANDINSLLVKTLCRHLVLKP